MEQTHQQSNLIKLYEEEIAAYKKQVEDLKTLNKHADDKNTVLLSKIRRLEDLVEKAHVANNDLHTAFEHVQSENLRMQRFQGPNLELQRVEESRAEALMDQCLVMANENISWTTAKERMTQRIKYLERECDRYDRDNNMLGKQVRHLLKTLEEERGMIIRRSSQVNEDERLVRASDVIDKHLVTFESIEELQKQNQNLLSLVKKLSAQEEEREMQIESEDVRRLTDEVNALKTQLDEVKNDRERIVNAFNTILKERDLFKILLCKTRQVEHMTPEIFQRMVSVACASGPAITNEPADTQDKDAHIIDLKAMISKLEQEISDLRVELEDTRRACDKDLKVKAELLEKSQINFVETSKRADSLIERNEVLTKNIDGLTKEFEEARTKLQRANFELEQMNKVKEDLDNALEREKQLRKSDLSSLISDIQSKLEFKNQLEVEVTRLNRQNQDFRDKLVQLEMNLRDKIIQIREIQQLRDIERDAKIELSRDLYKANCRIGYLKELRKMQKRRTKDLVGGLVSKISNQQKQCRPEQRFSIPQKRPLDDQGTPTPSKRPLIVHRNLVPQKQPLIEAKTPSPQKLTPIVQREPSPQKPPQTVRSDVSPQKQPQTGLKHPVVQMDTSPQVQKQIDIEPEQSESIPKQYSNPEPGPFFSTEPNLNINPIYVTEPTSEDVVNLEGGSGVMVELNPVEGFNAEAESTPEASHNTEVLAESKEKQSDPPQTQSKGITLKRRNLVSN